MTIRIGRLRITVSIASSVVNATTWDLPDAILWPRTAGFHNDSRGVHTKTNGNQNVKAQTTQTPGVIEVAQWTHRRGNNRRYRKRREAFTQSANGLQNNALMYSSCTDKPLKTQRTDVLTFVQIEMSGCGDRNIARPKIGSVRGR